MSDLEDYLRTGKRETLIPAWKEYEALCLKLRDLEKGIAALGSELASEKEHHRLLRAELGPDALNPCPECGEMIWDIDEDKVDIDDTYWHKGCRSLSLSTQPD